MGRTARQLHRSRATVANVHITLGPELLQRVGLGNLESRNANLVLRDIYRLLESRVGLRLREHMNNRQLDEFEQSVRHDEDIARRWLAEQFPDYGEVVAQEYERLERELSEIVSRSES
ncbi:MAG: hypothetical protein RL238_721 [Actinomycetota bacterium]|jgi:hypothetical protein